MRVPVPALVELRIAQPKVASDVDDDPPIVEPSTSLPRGLTSRQRGEDHLGIADVRSDHDRLGRAVQMRLRRAQRLALVGPSHGRDQPRLGVPQKQSRELAPGVAGDADDRYAGGHRKIMRSGG